MKPIRTLAAALLLAGAMAVGTPARAQDADTNLDKALQKVEALLTALKAIPGVDQKLVQALEEIASDLHKAKDGGKGGGGTPPVAPSLPSGVDEGIYKMTLTTFLTGLELKEDAKSLADTILREFVSDYKLAKDHEDEKGRAVIRDHTEKRIAQSFPSRDANHLKDNLDTIIKRWEWGGGRRGR